MVMVQLIPPKENQNSPKPSKWPYLGGFLFPGKPKIVANLFFQVIQIAKW